MSFEHSSSRSSSSLQPSDPTMPQNEKSPLQISLGQGNTPQHNGLGPNGASQPAQRHPATGLNPRSCIVCRKRKVRCDKAQPCSNCVRAQVPCHFPAPGRAPRRPRKPPDSELLARLRKLEGVVKNLGADAGDELISGDANLTQEPTASSPIAADRAKAVARLANERSDREKGSVDKSMGRLVLDEGRSRYVSNSFWANLSAEVDDLKGLLHEDSDEEGTFTDSPALSPVSDDQAFIFHHVSPTRDMPLIHPPPKLIEEFWNVYVEKVDPLTKILHLPTMRQHVDSCKSHPEKLTRGIEALIFSMYYAAISSLSSEECVSMTGESHKVLTSTYCRSAERALARANFLISEELVVVQGFLLFMLTLRRYEDPRVLWTLMGLLVRIAITTGLHRDGSVFGLPLFDAELRRRIWWQTVNLDIRLAEDHGSDVTILELLSDTRFPLNIHDKDWQPDMPSTIEDKRGVTEMSFSLIRFEISYLLRRLKYVPPPKRKPEDASNNPTIEDKERWVENFQKSLEEKYLRHCDLSIPMHWVISTMSRVIYCKLWLTIYQPFQRLDGGVGLPQQTRDRLFIASLNCLEYSQSMETEVRMKKWIWLFKSVNHWHALAYILNELCHRTSGSMVENAWRVVDAAVASWSARLSHQKKDHMWRPLRKLMTKARCARERGMALDSVSPGHTDPGQMDFTTSLGQTKGSELNNESKPAQESSAGTGVSQRRVDTYGPGMSLKDTSSLHPLSSNADGPDPYSPAWITLPDDTRRDKFENNASSGNHHTDSTRLSPEQPQIDHTTGSTDSKTQAGTEGVDWRNGFSVSSDPNQAMNNLDPLGKFYQSQHPDLSHIGPGLNHTSSDNILLNNFQSNTTHSTHPTHSLGAAYGHPSGTFAAGFPSQHTQQQAQTQSHSQPQLSSFDDPMVSGADMELDGQNLADWGEMIREFEMDDVVQPSPGFEGSFDATVLGNGIAGGIMGGEATGGQELGAGVGTNAGMGAEMGKNSGLSGVNMGGMNMMGTGMNMNTNTNTGMNMNMNMGINMGINVSNDANGATLQKTSSNQRRTRMGDSWFWL